MTKLDIREKTLDNGLRVVVCANRKAPVVSVNVVYHVGSTNEHRGQTGLAHLFEHLMFDNTTTGIDKQYDKYCARAGGSNNAYTTYDHTMYYISLPSHQLELGLWLESQRMAGFAITDFALTTQRNVVVEEIKQNQENQPYAKWNPAMDAAAFSSDSSYSWCVYGSQEDVSAVDMPTVEQFYNTHYHTTNAVLVIAGNVEFDDAFDRAEKHFGWIQRRPSQASTVTFTPTFIRKGVHSIEQDEVPLPAVFIAHHMPGAVEETMYDVDLVSGVLGSGKSALLYRDLVAGSRIASAAGCFVDKREHGSLLIAYAYAQHPSTTADQLANAMQRTLTNVTLTHAQRERLLNVIVSGLASHNQRISGVAESVATSTLFMGDAELPNRHVDNFKARTLDTMQVVVDQLAKADEAVRVDIIPRS